MSFSTHVNVEKNLLYVLGQSMITATDIDQYYSSLKATHGIEHCQKALVNLASQGVSLQQAPIKNIKSLGLLFKHAPFYLKVQCSAQYPSIRFCAPFYGKKR